MGLIFRSKETPADLFREVVDTAMSDVLNRVPKEDDSKGKDEDKVHMAGNSKRRYDGKTIVFESMEEVLERGKTDQPYKKTRNETTSEIVISCGGNGSYDDEDIDKMLKESWASSKGEDHNFVWQRVYLEVLTNISKSKNWSPIMKNFSNQIAYEYGNSVWNGIFDKNQRFFIMLWRMNVSYSISNVKKGRQRRRNFLIKEFYKLLNKASMNLSKEFGRVNFANSNVEVLEDFFERLLKEIKQDEDKTALMYMLELSNYFAEDFGKMLWYETFSELQKFIIVCSEVDRANPILKQYSDNLSRN